eukprot:159637_1
MVFQSITASLINSIAFCSVNVILLLSIIWITYKTIIEHKKSHQLHIMFLASILFNVTAFFCICGSSFKAYSDLANITISVDHPIFFPCNLVFLQNTLLVILLFIRIYYVFRGTPFQLTHTIILIFILSFIISIGIFISLLSTRFTFPNTHPSFTCAVTLCIFNLLFMISITSLFLVKLANIFKLENKIQISTDENNGLINIITKMTILSLISMSITFIACLFLLFRFVVFGSNIYTIIISEWATTIDIYSNFLCVSLTFNFFEKSYLKLCHCFDAKCKHICFIILIGSKNEAQLASKIESTTNKSKPDTNSEKIIVETKSEQVQKAEKPSDTVITVDASPSIRETPKTPFLQMTDYNSAYKIKNQLSKSKLGEIQ